MKYISLPPAIGQRRLSFYLAMEEYVARETHEEAFFIWQVEPSVIFGRNQSIENEVNTSYCRQHGIQMYRRKSGGGCVYADMGNLMLSYVSKEENVNMAFYTFMNMILLTLRKMGIDAVSTSHNDVLIDGRKVSGSACYHLQGRSIVHSTLLYDTQMENMVSAITPGEEKLQRKGIQSVRQRITLLRDHCQLSLPETKDLIRTTLCNGEMLLTMEDTKKIELIETSYLKNEFIHLIS
jgi:lipoic acid synthetase/lipoate-protein ligase A